MRPSLALELAGELSAGLSRSRPAALSLRRVLPSHASNFNPRCAYHSLSPGCAYRTLNPGCAHRSIPATARRHYADDQTPTPPQAARQPIPPTATTIAPTTGASSPSEAQEKPLQSLTDGLNDPPPELDPDERQVDWSRSFHGMSSSPFSPDQAAILNAEIPFDDIEIKPDGIVYLPEIKYRRILNKTFGPGGWGLAPRGETIITPKLVTREYGLIAAGRLISVARGEQQYFDPDGIPTATEGCKSNALMRCCKDLGIASELWDPRFIRRYLKEMAKELVVEHAVTKKRKKHWMRRDDELKWPLKEVQVQAQPVYGKR